MNCNTNLYELISVSFHTQYEQLESDPVVFVCEDNSISNNSDETKTSLEYDSDGIPIGHSLEDIKQRRQIIYQFYENWKKNHPEKSVFNHNLNADILIRTESVIETAAHASKRYKSTLAVLRLDEILSNAVQIFTDSPKPGNKNQSKIIKMILMKYECQTLGTIKLTVGVRRRSLDKIQYGITALQEGESIIPAVGNKKNKASHKK